MADAVVLDAPRAGIGGPQLAEMLGVRESTVHRWAHQLGYPQVGSGHRRWFTETDVLICRAWQMLNEHHADDGGHVAGPRYHHLRRMRSQAAAAIRRRPARWLIVTPYAAFTHPEAEDATRLALQLELRCWWLIDLWSRRG